MSPYVTRSDTATNSEERSHFSKGNVRGGVTHNTQQVSIFVIDRFNVLSSEFRPEPGKKRRSDVVSNRCPRVINNEINPFSQNISLLVSFDLMACICILFAFE